MLLLLLLLALLLFLSQYNRDGEEFFHIENGLPSSLLIHRFIKVKNVFGIRGTFELKEIAENLSGLLLTDADVVCEVAMM